MRQHCLNFKAVAFTYETGIEPLFLDASFHCPAGWTGVVGANGAGKTTLLKLATGFLDPSQGAIDAPTHLLYCSQRTDDPPVMLNAFLHEDSKTAWQLKAKLGVDADWPARWDTLSHGERKRAQIAVALWTRPNLLAVDEPTNHLDAEAREMIFTALRNFRGVGLLVSHDREMLDGLCGQCLFVDPPEVRMRPGGYTKGMEIDTLEQTTARRQLQARKQAYKRLEREAARRRAAADRSDRRRSKWGLNRKDHDAKEKRDRARVTGKDAVGGRLLRQMQGRVDRAREDLASIQVKKEHRLGIWLPGSVSKRDTLLRHPAGTIRLGGGKVLTLPDLAIRTTDRIALSGPNGSGKSTLIDRIVPMLNVPKAQVTYIPQEIGLERCRGLIDEARCLPGEKLGHLMTIVRRLGSDPKRLLNSGKPSPGEARKLHLAMGMTRLPHIILMDEPTNHMDLPSIECLEMALLGCPCALVLVSHDERFLSALTSIRWLISPSDGEICYRLKIVL